MRLIDRLYQYLELNRISPHAFEKTCGVANGYLKKQLKGKGGIGSEILEKIHASYQDLNVLWLLTGKGRMLVTHADTPEEEGLHEMREEERTYEAKEQLIVLLKDKINVLESANSDKDKIIRLLEKGSP